MRDLLGSLDDEACFGDIVWSGSALWLGIGELTSLFEAFCDNLVGRLALENPLTASVVSGFEAAEQLLELLMGPNGDAEHFAADPSVEAFDHAVIWHVGGGAAMSCRFRVGLGYGETIRDTGHREHASAGRPSE